MTFGRHLNQSEVKLVACLLYITHKRTVGASCCLPLSLTPTKVMYSKDLVAGNHISVHHTWTWRTTCHYHWHETSSSTERPTKPSDSNMNFCGMCSILGQSFAICLTDNTSSRGSPHDCSSMWEMRQPPSFLPFLGLQAGWRGLDWKTFIPHQSVSRNLRGSRGKLSAVMLRGPEDTKKVTCFCWEADLL